VAEYVLPTVHVGSWKPSLGKAIEIIVGTDIHDRVAKDRNEVTGDELDLARLPGVVNGSVPSFCKRTRPD
jgi:hypothetical protein